METRTPHNDQPLKKYSIWLSSRIVLFVQKYAAVSSRPYGKMLALGSHTMTKYWIWLLRIVLLSRSTPLFYQEKLKPVKVFQ
jgi:hypothetical protein